MQRGKTPWVPSQPTAIRPKVCEGVRTWSGSAAHRLANAVRLSSATGRVVLSRLPSQSIARCHRASCLLTSLFAPFSPCAPVDPPGHPPATRGQQPRRRVLLRTDGTHSAAGSFRPSWSLLRGPRGFIEGVAGQQASDAPDNVESDSAGAENEKDGMPSSWGGFPSRSPRDRGTGTDPTWSGGSEVR